MHIRSHAHRNLLQTRLQRASLSLVLALATGCARRTITPSAEPLRPLLYTEAPAGADSAVPGYETWTTPGHDPVAWPSTFRSQTVSAYDSHTLIEPTAPDRVMLDVFFALVTGDEARLTRHLFSPAELVTSARMNPQVAAEAAGEIEDATRALAEAFSSGVASELREGGVAALLEPGQLSTGRGRLIDGSLAGEDEEATMHWGSEMTLHVRGTELAFVLRFPSLLRAEDGTWKLRRAPQIDERFMTWRGAGFDRKPEMMAPGHAPFPLDVGNYWHYQTRETDETARARRAGRGYREEVVSVEEGLGYRVARIRTNYDRPGTPPTYSALLQTPLRIYPCDRECVRRASDAEWILDYAHRTTPRLVLPLSLGSQWGRGGRPTQERGHRVALEPEQAEVPSGTFDDALAITRSTSRGREVRLVVRGVGTVMLRTESATSTEIDELVEYRILH